jgi:cytochrome b561
MAIIERYSRAAIFLHWSIAVLITINLILVWSVNSVPESMIRPVIDTHKSIGITVLGLAILRLLWRATHPPPPYPSAYKLWERRLSHWAHIALYVLIFALPLTGWIHDSAWKSAPAHPMYLFGTGSSWPRISWIMNLDPATKEMVHRRFFGIHKDLAEILYVFVALHVLGALKHQFFDREKELQRMLPGK